MKQEIKEDKELRTEETYQKHAKKFFEDKRTKTAKLYNAYSEYIECLENSLEYEEDLIKKYHIRKEIKKLKKEQKRFSVPTVLTQDMCKNKENRNYDPSIFQESNCRVTNNIEEQEKNREDSSNVLIKTKRNKK